MIKFVLAILVGAVALVIWWSQRQRRKAGIRKWYRNPAEFFAEGNRMESERAVEVPAHPTEEQIQEQVSNLLHKKTARRARFWLSRAGSPALPALCAALSQERFLRTQRETVSLGGDAFEIVVEILGEIGDPAAIDSLLPHVDSRFAETRKCVGLALGSIGHLDGLRGLKRLLDDEDAYVRSHVLIGIDRGINSHRATPALLDGLRESLMRLLEIKDTGFESKPAELLLHLDRGWALTVLLGDRVLRADNPNVVGILRSLRKTNVILPARALERLDLEFDALPDGYQKEYGKGQMLLARAAARLPDAEEKAQAAVSSQSREIRNGAADALAWLAGVENPIEFVESREREVGWEGLTQPQRNFSAVWMLEAEVNNGGFSQYFFNSWSDHWPDALTGLNAIGARRTAEILQRAVAVFGPEGPATDREARMDQLSKLIDRCEKELDDLDDQFYKETDPLYVQYMLYAAKHADQFGGLSRLT